MSLRVPVEIIANIYDYVFNSLDDSVSLKTLSVTGSSVRWLAQDFLFENWIVSSSTNISALQNRITHYPRTLSHVRTLKLLHDHFGRNTTLTHNHVNMITPLICDAVMPRLQCFYAASHMHLGSAILHNLFCIASQRYLSLEIHSIQSLDSQCIPTIGLYMPKLSSYLSLTVLFCAARFLKELTILDFIPPKMTWPPRLRLPLLRKVEWKNADATFLTFLAEHPTIEVVYCPSLHLPKNFILSPKLLPSLKEAWLRPHTLQTLLSQRPTIVSIKDLDLSFILTATQTFISVNKLNLSGLDAFLEGKEDMDKLISVFPQLEDLTFKIAKDGNVVDTLERLSYLPRLRRFTWETIGVAYLHSPLYELIPRLSWWCEDLEYAFDECVRVEARRMSLDGNPDINAGKGEWLIRKTKF